jgi:EmrB/QacA subfamily drug resistance transporter
VTLTAEEEARAALRRRVVTAACFCGTFMVAVEVTIVGTAMPTIVGQLGDFSLFTWVFAAYILTSAVTAPVYGRLADLYGRKRLYFIGAGLFLIGSLLCGFAPNMLWLIAFRALQGLGSGALQPLIITILSDLHTGQDRARVLAGQSSIWGIAAIVGPVIGAFTVAYVSWSYVFWINLPIGAFTVLVLSLAFKEKLEPRPHDIDYAGAGLLMTGAGALLLAAIQAQDLPGVILVALCSFGIVALALLYFQEKRTAEPIVPLALWRIRTVTISNLGALCIGVVLSCTTLYLTTFVQAALGFSALYAGAVFACQSLAWSFGSAIAARLMQYINFVATAAIGAVLLLIGCGVLAAMNETSGIVWVTGGATLVGLGMGLCNTTYILVCQSEVAWNDRGGVVSANIFLRMIGMAIGAGVGGALVNFWLARLTPGALDTVRQLLDPVLRGALAPGALAEMSGAIAYALRYVYIAGFVFAAGALICAFSLPRGLRLSGRKE